MRSTGKLWATVIAASAALGAVATGCGGDKGTGPGTGAIVGTVYRAGSAIPVPGALVTCAGVADTSNGQGVYQLDNVPIGRHTLNAAKANYEIYTATVNVTGKTQQNIFIIYKSGGGGDLGE